MGSGPAQVSRIDFQFVTGRSESTENSRAVSILPKGRNGHAQPQRHRGPSRDVATKEIKGRPRRSAPGGRHWCLLMRR